MENTNYGVINLIIHDFLSIPNKIKRENRFCLWKYERFSELKSKPLKRPYGIDSSNQIIPSLKQEKY